MGLCVPALRGKEPMGEGLRVGDHSAPVSLCFIPRAVFSDPGYWEVGDNERKEHAGCGALDQQACWPTPPGPQSPHVFPGIRLLGDREVLTAMVLWKAP